MGVTSSGEPDPVVTSLRSLVTQFKIEKDEYKAEAERLREENEALRAQLRASEEQHKAEVRCLQDAQKAESSALRERLKGESDALRVRLRTSEEAAKALKDEVRAANKALKDVMLPQSVRDETLKDELYTLKTTQKALKEENELLRRHVTLLQESVGYRRAQNESMASELTVLRACVAKFRGAVALFASNFAGYFGACTAELPGAESERAVADARATYTTCENSLRSVKERIDAVQNEIAENSRRSSERIVSSQMWRERYADLCARGEDPFGTDLYSDADNASQGISDAAGTSSVGVGSGVGEPVSVGTTGIDGDGGIGMNELIDRVIGMNFVFNGQLMRDFCTMHRTFTDSETVFRTIGYKFKATFSLQDKQMQIITQTKIVNFVQKWIENFPHDFQSVGMQGLVNMFAHVLLDGNKILSDLILKTLARPIPGVVAAAQPPAQGSADDPGVTLQLLEVSPAELARQITMLDYAIFSRISYMELVDPNNWNSDKENGLDPALNVRAFIKRFNKMTSWVQTEVLSRDTPKDRAAVIRYFITLGKELLAINNFSSLMAIGLAFRTAAMTRLHQTFDYLTKKCLSKKEKASYDEIRTLTSESQNWKLFRKALETAQGSCIPHLGIFLSDIQFATDGMPEHVRGGLNFAKKRKIASIINFVLNFQPTPYTFSVDVKIRTWINSVPVYDQDKCFEISKKLEPANSSGSAGSSGGSASSSSSSSSSSTSSSASSSSSSSVASANSNNNNSNNNNNNNNGGNTNVSPHSSTSPRLVAGSPATTTSIT